MAKKKKIAKQIPMVQWPVKRTKKLIGKNKDGSRTYTRRDGEPTIISLVRYDNDHSLTGIQRVGCCDCSLVHIYHYSLCREPGKNGEFFLVKRAYRV